MRQCQNRFRNLVFCTLMYTGMFTAASTATAQGLDVHFPEPDPPTAHQPPVETSLFRMLALQASPDTEWFFHKTADNQHPDGIEQQMTWLMNRARSNPTQEGIWLATMDDPDVASARSYFNVNLGILQAEFAAIQAKPPAAFDVRLYQAAKAHSDYLIANDEQSHNGQLDRVGDAGFSYQSWRGNVFSFTKSGLHGHAGFNIDWGGNDGTGMQTGRGHRKAIMSMDGDYTNVGLALVAEADAATNVGPLVTTGNYCFADTGKANHFNRFLVGTVWHDLNHNDRYDPGEGVGGIAVRPDQGTYYAVTADSGGYAIPILDPGTYTVTFSGSGIDGKTTRTVSMGSQSFLLDLVYNGRNPGDPEAVTGSASVILQNTVQLNGTVNANGQDVDYYFEYGPTTQYGDISDAFSTTANENIAIALSELSAGTLYHFRLVVVTETATIYGNDCSFETAPADGSDPQIPQGGGGGCFIDTIYRWAN